MGDAMAGSAFRELSHHGCRVTVTVTALALRHHLVFCLMAGYACQLAVLEFTCGKQIIRLLMAGGAVFGRSFIIIGNVFRHMCLVTLFAVGRGLFSVVSFVALGAERNFAVCVMAEAAVKCGMLALVIAQFDNLTGMTGNAGVGYIVAEGNIEWCVWVFMATHTGGQLIVCFSLVALATERNDLPIGGRVPVVTILTANLSFMLATVSSNIRRWFAVTFGAVIIRKLRGGGDCRVGGEDHALNSEQGKTCQYKYPYIFHQTAFFHRCYLLAVI